MANSVNKISINGEVCNIEDSRLVTPNTGHIGVDIHTLALGSCTLQVTRADDSPSITIGERVRIGDGVTIQSGIDITQDSLNGMTNVKWTSESDMNDFKTPGTYNIYGERTKQDDNLPILNASPGHSIAARLIVVASTLQPANNEICITQMLLLSNRQGGDGNMYVRTYNKNNSPFSDGWNPWQKLQGIREGYIFTDELQVDPDGSTYQISGVTGLNNMIDNGIYSGVYTDYGYLDGRPTFLETFTLIVINNYAVAGKDERLKRTISQLKYAVDAITNQATIKKRTKTDGDDKWGDWTDIGGGSNEVDITDVLNQHGLPTLYAQGFMQNNVIYKYEQPGGNLPKLDPNDKIRQFLISKGFTSNFITVMTIQKCYPNIILEVNLRENTPLSSADQLNYYKFIMDTSNMSYIKVSADMVNL